MAEPDDRKRSGRASREARPLFERSVFRSDHRHGRPAVNGSYVSDAPSPRRTWPLVPRAPPYIAPVRLDLERLGIATQIETVPYEFQRGGNQMLRIWPTRCATIAN